MGFLTGALFVGWRAARHREKKYRHATTTYQQQLAAIFCCECCNYCGHCGPDDFCPGHFYDDVYG